MWNPIFRAGWSFLCYFLMFHERSRSGHGLHSDISVEENLLDFYITVDQPHKTCVNTYNTASALWEFNSITGHNGILGLLSLLLFFPYSSIDYSKRGELFPRCSEITKRTGPDLFFHYTRAQFQDSQPHPVCFLLICSVGEALKLYLVKLQATRNLKTTAKLHQW